MKRWTHRPEGSTWGDFGEDDVLGRLNLITPEKVLQGIAAVEEGRSYCLSLPLDLPGGTDLNPNRLPPVVRPNLRAGAVNMNYVSSAVNPNQTDVLSDDLVLLHTQYSTQWDSFAHVGSEFDVHGTGTPVPVYYNGYRAGGDITGPETVAGAGVQSFAGADPADYHTTSSAGPLGIDSMAAASIQGRAVLIDIAHHFGTEHRVVGFDDLQHIIEADRITVEEGDILLIHTGFAEKVLAMAGTPEPDVLHHYGAVLDGRDARLLSWITESGIAAIAADNYAVELYPARPAEGASSHLPLHEHCLFRLGVPLGELWYLTALTTALRTRGRSTCLLTAPPLRLPGAVGSPLTPVATI